MTTTTEKKLEGNIATYSKNHFQHNKTKGSEPSLLQMQIHETEDVTQSPSLLKMQIHEHSNTSSITDFRNSVLNK